MGQPLKSGKGFSGNGIREKTSEIWRLPYGALGLRIVLYSV